jgi:hypothetical protein
MIVWVIYHLSWNSRLSSAIFLFTTKIMFSDPYDHCINPTMKFWECCQSIKFFRIKTIITGFGSIAQERLILSLEFVLSSLSGKIESKFIFLKGNP